MHRFRENQCALRTGGHIVIAAGRKGRSRHRCHAADAADLGAGIVENEVPWGRGVEGAPVVNLMATAVLQRSPQGTVVKTGSKLTDWFTHQNFVLGPTAILRRLCCFLDTFTVKVCQLVSQSIQDGPCLFSPGQPRRPVLAAAELQLEGHGDQRLAGNRLPSVDHYVPVRLLEPGPGNEFPASELMPQLNGLVDASRLQIGP